PVLRLSGLAIVTVAPEEIVPPNAFRLAAVGPTTAVAVPKTRLLEPRMTLPVCVLAAERLSVPDPPIVRPTEPAAIDPVMALVMVNAPVEPPELAVMRMPSAAP